MSDEKQNPPDTCHDKEYINLGQLSIRLPNLIGMTLNVRNKDNTN